MRYPDREHARRHLLAAHLRGRPRPDQVRDHRHLARGVGHRREEPLPFGEPLAVYLEVQHHNGHREHPPKRVVGRAAAGSEEESGLQEEQPRDPRREEVVHAHVVQELGLHVPELEEAAAGVEGAEQDERGERYGPEEDEGGGGEHPDDVPKRTGVGARLAKGLPQQSLAAQRQANAEVPGMESSENRHLGRKATSI